MDQFSLTITGELQVIVKRDKHKNRQWLESEEAPIFIEVKVPHLFLIFPTTPYYLFNVGLACHYKQEKVKLCP